MTRHFAHKAAENLRHAAAKTCRSLIFLFILQLLLSPLWGQEIPTNEFGVWVKWQLANGHAIGDVVDSRMYEAVGRYSRLISSNRTITLHYVAEVIPLSIVGSPQANGQRLYSYAAGAVPAGIQLNWVHYGRLQPFLEGGGGFLYFNRQMFYGTQLHFTAKLGMGLQILSCRHRSLDVGYEYHHMSNANLANNPGMDSHAIFMGLSFLK